MQEVQVIENGTHLVRGTMEENAVLAGAGNFIDPRVLGSKSVAHRSPASPA